MVATLPGDRWPDVLPSTTAAAYRLTVHNASSSHYTLTVMTWVARRGWAGCARPQRPVRLAP